MESILEEVNNLGIELIREDRGIIVNGEWLVIADLHLGYEISLAEEGIYFPEVQYKEFVDRLIKIKNTFNISKIVINGDLKHKFSYHSSIGWKIIENFIEFLAEEFEKAIFIRGNHDTFLIKYLKKYNFELLDYYTLDNIFITHGHKFFDNSLNYKAVVIGDEHPAISLYDEIGIKHKIKVFLVGRTKNNILIVLPSFSDLFPGLSINEVPKEELTSPYLKSFLNDDFLCIPVDETLPIFKLSDVKDMIS